jgi:hypothetical protein
MPHKRSLDGKQKRQGKKALRYVAKAFIRENTYKDVETGEEANKASPYELTFFLEDKHAASNLKVIAPYVYGSVLDLSAPMGERFLVQAAQGLVFE